nr:MAG TPA: hypothetical protein [Caudoviricetes sp.]
MLCFVKVYHGKSIYILFNAYLNVLFYQITLSNFNYI